MSKKKGPEMADFMVTVHQCKDWGGRSFSEANMGRKTDDTKALAANCEFQIELVVGKKKQKTRSISNDVRATWNETFTFPIPKPIENQHLLVRCKNRGKLMGDLDIEVSVYQGIDIQAAKPRWFKLGGIIEKTKEPASGELRLSLGFAGVEAAATPLAEGDGRAAAVSDDQARSDLLGAPKGKDGKPIPVDPEVQRRRDRSRKQDKEKTMSELQEEMDDITTESVASVKRTLKTLDNTVNIAQETNVELERQDEVLRKTQEEADKIHTMMDVADRNIAGINSMWSDLGNQFKSDIKKRDRTKATDKEISEQQQDRDKSEAKESKKERKEKEKERKKRAKHGAPADDSAVSVKASSSDGVTTAKTRTNLKEVDKGLDQVSDYLGQLKGMALDMRNKIDDSGKRIDALNEDIGHGGERLKTATRNMAKNL